MNNMLTKGCELVTGVASKGLLLLSNNIHAALEILCHNSNTETEPLPQNFHSAFQMCDRAVLQYVSHAEHLIALTCRNLQFHITSRFPIVLCLFLC